MVQGDWNMSLTKTEGDYIHQVNGETSSFPEESTLTLLPIQHPIQRDFSSNANRWNVTMTTHRHLVLWLQISGGVSPLPYMLSCIGTTLPFYWSWPILLQNPPGRCQENCINMNTVAHVMYRALSTQHIVSDSNLTLVHVIVYQLQCCLLQHTQLSLAVKWTPPTCITRHYNHEFFFCKFFKDTVCVLMPNIPK